MLLWSGFASSLCTNSSTFESQSFPGATIPATVELSVNMPSQPNKKFSAYIFRGGVLKGVVRSNKTTDALGRLLIVPSAVDANNCELSEAMKPEIGLSYNVHYRLDSTGTNNFVYPSLCASDAGFLSETLLGAQSSVNFKSGKNTLSVTSLNNTSTLTFNFSNTGIAAADRQTKCIITDGGISQPLINVSSTMGITDGLLTYNAGGGSATTSFRVPAISSGFLKYSCWVDFDGAGVVSAGDLIAYGTITGFTVTISTWGTVTP